MGYKKRSAYWLLLLALVLVVSGVLSVGETQARYVEDIKILNTVAVPVGNVVTSDCLVSAAEAPLTILLGQMQAEDVFYPVSFMLASGSDVMGNLTWTVDQGAYLNVSMTAGEAALPQSGSVELKKDTPVMVTMTLTPTEKALTTAHDEMDVNVTVTWSDALKGELEGTFRITLPAVTAAVPETEENHDTPAPSQSQDDESNTVPTQPKDDEGGTEPSQPEEEGIVTEEPGETELVSPVSVDVALTGSMTLNGRVLYTGEFTFLLYETDKTYTAAETAVPVKTAVNDENGKFAFEALTFSAAGNYYYIVREDSTVPLGGIAYDGCVYRICVAVTDNAGQLEAAVSITDDSGSSAEKIQFENTYTPVQATFSLDGEVRLSGALLKQGMFSFLLYQADENFAPQGDPVQTVKNQADGSFAFADLAYTAAGKYHYVIQEDQSAPLSNMRYDGRQYGVTVMVTDNGSGQLSAAGSLTVIGADVVDTILFENTYIPTGNEAPVIQLSTLGSSPSGAALPVKVGVVEGIEQIQLGTGSNGETGISAFPAYTRYSLDGGESDYMLYRAGLITLEADAAQPAAVLLELPAAAQAEDREVVLTAQAFANQSLIGSASVSTKVTMEQLCQIRSPILSQKSPLEMVLPGGWKDGMLEYAIEMLSNVSADGEVPEQTYVKVDLTGEKPGLVVTYSADPENGEAAHMLKIQTGETLPTPGTYRVNMKWTYEGICFEQTQITFFVNYSVYSDLDRTGGTEQ